MIYNLIHITRFDFDEVQNNVLQKVRLFPSNYKFQRIIKWDIKSDDADKELVSKDYHGNTIQLFRKVSDKLFIEIQSTGEVEVIDNDGIVGEHDNLIPLELYKNETKLTYAGNRVKKFFKKFKNEINKNHKIDDVQLLHKLSYFVKENIKYTKEITDINTTAEDVISLRKGVCQDHVHVFLSLARLLGFSARYVSGYLMMNNNNIQNASHAWAEVYLNQLGWIGLDISNFISPTLSFSLTSSTIFSGSLSPKSISNSGFNILAILKSSELLISILSYEFIK